MLKVGAGSMKSINHLRKISNHTKYYNNMKASSKCYDRKKNSSDVIQNPSRGYERN
ncbi:unnamed protein product, partial [Musa textilis]